MNDSNQQTIQSYEAHVQEYINGTVQDVGGVVKEWLDEALAGLPKDAAILEFGSAFGRDAAYMQNMGYTVQCTDATQAFVDLLKQKGFDARLLNAITDNIDGSYDFVLANAVLLHFTRKETAQVLKKVLNALNDGGTFAFTLKQGEGEKWSEEKLGAPRYFCYWTEEQVRQLLEDSGFSDVKVTGDRATANATWLQVIARKQG
jgi:2-polyprenyl-3-methyl-5-hydroxy-6-metoxy-1,4-benzoquinol methylase